MSTALLTAHLLSGRGAFAGALTALAAALLVALPAPQARAQTPADPPALQLRMTPRLQEAIPKTQRGDLTSFISGDAISGRPDLETLVEGNAELRRGDIVIKADRIEYYAPDDLAQAVGNVRINRAGNVYEGPDLELKLETFEGFFNRVRYDLLATGGRGDAERLQFLDQSRTVALNATYTTCRREDFPGWMPAWLLSATRITTDSESDTGVAENAQLTFMGITTPAFPSLSFPLSSARKSGFLPPTVGIDNVNGVEVVQPWYWNIAPNRDATITPTLMSKRGVNISTEFGYLEEKYRGNARVDFMPTDRLRNRSRWGIWSHHEQTFGASAFGLDSLTGTLDINHVSDDDYWRDFQRTPSLTGRLLASNGVLNWRKGDFSGMVRALAYQTLRYDEAPIKPPYDRLPQITANYDKYDWNGLDIHAGVDFTRFRARPGEQGQPNGDRAFALLSVSRPWLTPGSFIIPKLQVQGTTYQLDGPLADGRTTANSAVPTFSLDSGLIYERDVTLFGRALRQTLEPRAFYVYTPKREQNNLPVYDTATNDFNFATIYTENAFSGNDRISDSNTLTLGTSTRFIDASSGAELAKFAIAQRLRFADQTVTLPGGKPVTDRVSDLLLGAQINWTPKWSLDTTVQYNPDTHRSVRNSIGGRYSPGPYRTVSLAYRYQDDSVAASGTGSKSIDLGFQWPINDLWGDKGGELGRSGGQGEGRWYAVGRLNYSIKDSRMTDAVLGLEYDGCCYIGRVVYEELSTGLASRTKRIMFQIEFVGFSSIGTSPMRSLRTNIPRYQPLRTPYQAPSRFTNYE